MSRQHHRPGPHELGQNDLVDRRTITAVVALARECGGPYVEWAAGRGALTRPLARIGAPLHVVELDPRRVAALERAALGPHVCIGEGDILRHAPPAGTRTLVANLPFHVTTPALRHLLRETHWQHALLITQWEVARKRAGVGGATQLTAQWWPWVDTGLVQRIPATAFRPVPSVDAGLLHLRRRPEPLLPASEQRDYHEFVRRVFGGRGRHLAQILTGAGVSREAANRLAAQRRPGALPRDLDAATWVAAYRSRRT